MLLNIMNDYSREKNFVLDKSFNRRMMIQRLSGFSMYQYFVNLSKLFIYRLSPDKMKPYALLVLFLFTAPQLSGQVKSSKRGVAYGYHSAADMNVASSGISWWYNWAAQPDAAIRTTYSNYNVDFVPQAWNAAGISGVNAWVSQDPKVKYILGFNEPNFIDQANMTPTQAAAAWPQLQAVADQYGLKLVSPAVNYCGNCVSENGTTYTNPFKWLDDFFTACNGCRVDYIGLHWYGGGNSMTGYIEGARKYGKPIWVTEFADWDAGITAENQKSYLAGTVNFLERDPGIFRYSWFIGRGDGAAVYPYIDLYGTSGTMTALGQLYLDIPVYDSTKVYQIPGRIEAEEYYSQNGIFAELTTDMDGFMNIGYTDAGDWLEYKIDVSESGDYFLMSRYAGTSAGSFDVYVDNVKRGTVNTTITGGWQSWTSAMNTIHLDAGLHKLKLLVVNKGFNLNWLNFSKSTTGISSRSQELFKVTVFPNPVNGDKLKILFDGCSSNEITIQVTGINGKEIYTGKIEKPDSREIEISLKNIGIISKGVYFISFQTRKGYLNKKIVVL
jgi:hypothetical protein